MTSGAQAGKGEGPAGTTCSSGLCSAASGRAAPALVPVLPMLAVVVMLGVGALAWSVLALSLGGSSLLYLLIQRGAATTVTSLMYLVPPATAVLAWILFGEPITALTVAGVTLTALGVSLVVRASPR